MASTVSTPTLLVLQGGRLLHQGPRGPVVREIETTPLIVGRDPTCGLVLDEPDVSHLHAELVATAEGVRLRDLGSKNGTWVGDARVVEVYLGAKCSLWVGGTELIFEPRTGPTVALSEAERFGPLFGTSVAMRSLFDRLSKAAVSDATVLVHGETGTGKELVAQALHAASKRRHRPFVVVDCGALAPSLVESTLFGHEKGAFTGAAARRLSPFIEADGGTIFLDELGELPLDMQPKLLRALAERRVQALGGTGYRPFDVRVVAATRRDLLRAIADGSFRSDLYFRVAQLVVAVPPLRERLEDAPGLVRAILDELGESAASRRIAPLTFEKIARHDWPGNVRELRNAIIAGLALAEAGGVVDIVPGAVAAPPPGRDFHAFIGAGGTFHEAKRAALDEVERKYFTALQQAVGDNVSEMSRRAGLDRNHVRKYLDRANLLGPANKRSR